MKFSRGLATSLSHHERNVEIPSAALSYRFPVYAIPHPEEFTAPGAYYMDIAIVFLFAALHQPTAGGTVNLFDQ